jgi:IclR family transcriptional regulator, KDG regulon repressor
MPRTVRLVLGIHKLVFSYSEDVPVDRPSTSLARALHVLGSILDRGEARADELAADAAVPVSTVYRYLRDLRDAGFVADSGGVYRPGPRLAGAPDGSVSRTDLRRLLRPTLEALSSRSGETALTAVRAGTHALCLDQVESPQAMRMAFRVGQVLPLHAGAASRTLLAYAPDEVVAAVSAELEALTPATPGSDELPRRLATIRGDGIATSRGELVPGALAIAVPVLAGERCVCSLAIAAPEHRAGGAWQREAKRLLQAARRDAEALL